MRRMVKLVVVLFCLACTACSGVSHNKPQTEVESDTLVTDTLKQSAPVKMPPYVNIQFEDGSCSTVYHIYKYPKDLLPKDIISVTKKRLRFYGIDMFYKGPQLSEELEKYLRRYHIEVRPTSYKDMTAYVLRYRGRVTEPGLEIESPDVMRIEVLAPLNKRFAPILEVPLGIPDGAIAKVWEVSFNDKDSVVRSFLLLEDIQYLAPKRQ